MKNPRVESGGALRRDVKWNIHRAVIGALVMAAAVSAPPARAEDPQPAPQQAETTAPAGESAPVAEVVVTGTSIKRADSAALPITAVSADQMALRDANTPADMLMSLPAVVNVPINDANQGGAGARGDVAGVNLRGIGAGDTLVLLNGRRIAANAMPSSSSSPPLLVTNANVVPLEGLERVDILRDGASSIYGSDAVAGVINFVTDNKYTGTDVQAQARGTGVGSGNEAGLSIRHGANFMDERLHWTSVLDIFYRQELWAREAGEGVPADKSKLVPAGWASKFNGSSSNGLYTSFYTPCSSTQLSSGQCPAAVTSAANFYPSYNINGNYTLPAGFSPGTLYYINPATSMISTTRPASLDLNQHGTAEPSTRRANWYNALDYQLSDRTTLYTELSLYRADSIFSRAPVPYAFPSDTVAAVPASNQYNPLGPAGVPVVLNSMRFQDFGNETVFDVSDFARWVGGARGQLAGSWTYDTALLFSIDHTTDIAQNDVRESPFEQGALAQGTYNPFYYTFPNGPSQPGTQYMNTPAQMSTFEAHLEQFGVSEIESWDGHVNGELFQLPAGAVQVATGGEVRHESLRVNRPLYSGVNCTPYAPTQCTTADAQGYVLTPEGYRVLATNNDFIQASAGGNAVGDRIVGAVFAETVIPVFDQQNALPGLQKLEFSAAVRYEHYSDFGGTTNPKFSFDWRPEQHVMIRGSYGKGFRAPDLAALYTPARSSVGTTSSDPYYQQAGIVTSQLAATETGFGRYTTQELEPGTTLRPERSSSETFGVVIDAPHLNGLSFSADYWQIHQTDVIGALPGSRLSTAEINNIDAATKALLAKGDSLASITPMMLASQLYSMGLTDTPTCVANPLNGGGLTYDSYFDPGTRSAIQRSCDPSSPSKAATNAAGYAWAGTLINTVTPYLNMASATIDGVDFDITYKSQMTPIGRFQVVSDATWLLDYQRYVTATSPVEHDIGRGGASRWRGNFNLLWYYKGWNAGIGAYYIGDYADPGASFPSIAQAQAAKVPASSIYAIDGVAYWKIKSTITANIFASYTWGTPTNKWLDGLSLRLAIDDLTDRRPPLSSGQEGYDASVYSSLAVGRVYSLEVNKRF